MASIVESQTLDTSTDFTCQRKFGGPTTEAAYQSPIRIDSDKTTCRQRAYHHCNEKSNEQQFVANGPSSRHLRPPCRNTPEEVSSKLHTEIPAGRRRVASSLVISKMIPDPTRKHFSREFRPIPIFFAKTTQNSSAIKL